jgi:hypothetical protein
MARTETTLNCYFFKDSGIHPGRMEAEERLPPTSSQLFSSTSSLSSSEPPARPSLLESSAARMADTLPSLPSEDRQQATEASSALQQRQQPSSSPSRATAPTVRATRTCSSVGPPPDPALPGSRPTETLMSRDRLAKSLYGSLGQPGRGIWHDLQAVRRACRELVPALPTSDRPTDAAVPPSRPHDLLPLRSALPSVRRTTFRTGQTPTTTASYRRRPTSFSQTSWSVLGSSASARALRSPARD